MSPGAEGRWLEIKGGARVGWWLEIGVVAELKGSGRWWLHDMGIGTGFVDRDRFTWCRGKIGKCRELWMEGGAESRGQREAG